LCSFLFVMLVIYCSVDYSLLENKRCDSEGKCLSGYICDRATMTCIKEGSLIHPDASTSEDAGEDTLDVKDVYVPDVEQDVGCIPTNNGKEICDGIDNDCDGRTDEDYVCGSCELASSISEPCNESTNCDRCFIINGERYSCVSFNGGDFSWMRESDIECDSSKSGKVVRCENICRVCDGTKYNDPFIINNEACDGKDNNCNGLIDEGDICGSDEICVNGKCVTKPCFGNEDCPTGKICKNQNCTICTDVTDDKLCGSGKICVNNSCIEGDCHQNSDCQNGICVSNKCCTSCCAKKEDCPSEMVCKKDIGKSIGTCETCIDFVDDWLCGLGYICENKKCIKGTCHPSRPICLPGMICVNYNCCTPGPNCCNNDSDCKANMICNAAHSCECKTLFGDCDNKYDNGCEKDLSSDVNNCGTCGQKCVLPNANQKCVSGICEIESCKPGFRDCNNNKSDGCEINITNDLLNCGDCNVQCLLDNADSICSNSECKIKACKPGFADCNGKVEDGCEINVMTDSDNCGDCGKRCPEPKACLNGTCK